MTLDSKIFVAGHRGLVGSAILRTLERRGYSNVLVRSRTQVDLRDSQATLQFFKDERPEVVFLAAAKVGGILANSTKPAEFIADNLAIQSSVIEAAFQTDVEKFVFLGSSCIYPKECPQPIREEYLLTGPLEPTNEPYAIAKIAGLKMCEAYRKQYGFDAISVMPTNLYGPGDNFDLASSHVLPALIRKFHDAKSDRASEVVVWGSGKPRREFLHCDDLADAVVFLADAYSDAAPINVGVGDDVTIAELAGMVKDVVGYDGRIVYDSSKPDGTPRKLLDVSKLHSLGWEARIALPDGLCSTYEWYLASACACPA